MSEKIIVSLHNLRPTPGARRRPLRLGMGEGSGTGQTATRGQKGQRSRSGDGKMSGFEGGQTPLLRRIPKRGFTNGPFRRLYQIVSLADIQRTLFDRAVKFREEHTSEASTYDEFKQVLEGRPGFVLAPWCGSAECEAGIKADTQATIRNLPLEESAGGVCVRCGQPGMARARFAKAY